MEDIKLLKIIPLFKGFSTTELANVSMVAKSKLYEAHDAIVKEKARGDGVYIIKSGKVRVLKTDSFGTSMCWPFSGAANISARSAWWTRRRGARA